jgi:thioredoxin-like negative regulator of GroEL
LAIDHLKEIQKEFSHIRAHEEDDLEWWNEGLDLLDQEKFAEAETRFKMLVMSQPGHSDGFEGLARVYTKMKRTKEAKYFINLAAERAQNSVRSGFMDQEVLDIILEQKKAIERS